MHRLATATLAAFLVLVLQLPAAPATAESHSAAAIDEDALAERIARKVMQRIQQGDFLDARIDQGIERYIARQRAAQARAGGQRAAEVRRVTADRDHVYGNQAARVSVIEYSDFECPFCKRFHPTVKQVVDASDGNINWVYRHFPLGFHNPLAQRESEATECAAELAGNDGFWRYADTLYERTTSNGNGFPYDGFVPLAVELGMNAADFETCLESGRHAARVNEDLVEGQAIGVTGTPGSVLLDNRTGRARLVSGAVPLQRLRDEIDALLAAE